MADEDNNTKLEGVLKQQTALFEKLTEIYKAQDALWEKMTKDAKDTDGDGLVDVDKTSANYKEYEQLQEQANALWKEVEALDIQLEELDGGFSADSMMVDFNLVEGTSGDDDLTGTDKMDNMLGQAGNDQLSGGKEFDLMDGGDGNDTVSGGDGDDNIMGGDGDDELNGDEGADYIDGGRGNDTIAGGKGGDHFSLSGNSGHDTITDFDVTEDKIDLWAEGVTFADLKSEKNGDGLKVSWGDNSVLLKGVTADLSEDWFFVSDVTILPIEPGEVVNGTDGNDNLKGGDGWDYMNGGKGDDTLSGGKEGDSMGGDEGNDVLDGGEGYDHMDGGEGNDTMTGGAGGDSYSFHGNSGQDVITDFNPKEDFLNIYADDLKFEDLKSEKTSDGLKVSWGENSVLLKGVTVDLSKDWVYVAGDQPPIIIDPIPVEPGEFLEGTDGNDDLSGGDGWDYLNGGKGDDKLSGGKEGDSLYGDEGNDTLDGGDGFDYLHGGAGNDSMTGGEGADHYSFDGDSGHDVITDFNPEEDTISAMADGLKFADVKSEQTSDGLKVSWGNNSVLLKGVTADLSEDWFYANDGAIIEPIEPVLDINIVRGTDESDTLTGGDGYDDLYGGKGDDVLDGGKDVDYLFGEEGNDTMTGGENVDIFFFAEKSGNDTITDFNPGEDILDLTGVDVEYKDISSRQENGGTLVSWGDNSVFLTGITDAMDESWFGLGSQDGVVSFSS